MKAFPLFFLCSLLMGALSARANTSGPTAAPLLMHKEVRACVESVQERMGGMLSLKMVSEEIIGSSIVTRFDAHLGSHKVGTFLIQESHQPSGDDHRYLQHKGHMLRISCRFLAS